MATGTSAGPLWKNSARIYVLLPRNAGQTGTSQRPNSRRRGSKAARTSSIRTAKPTPKLSVNRIRRVEHLRVVERHISDAAPFFVQHVVEFRRGRLLCLDCHRDGGRSHIVSSAGFLRWARPCSH